MAKIEITLPIDETLLARARAAAVDPADVLEAALRAAIAPGVAEQAAPFDSAEARAGRWAEENAEAIKAYNGRIEREGCFGEDWRSW